MPDPSHRPYNPMLILKSNSLPRFWWLKPWSIAIQLHKNAVALREMADRLDKYNDALKAEVVRLAHSRDHWIAKHDRAHAVAMHNERVIADMEERSR